LLSKTRNSKSRMIPSTSIQVEMLINSTVKPEHRPPPNSDHHFAVPIQVLITKNVTLYNDHLSTIATYLGFQGWPLSKHNCTLKRSFHKLQWKIFSDLLKLNFLKWSTSNITFRSLSRYSQCFTTKMYPYYHKRIKKYLFYQ
jgi:hypothetical protein